MELIKRDDRFDLYNEDGHKIASTLKGCVNKLSLKNCQAIERGYDLDELAKDEFENSGWTQRFREEMKDDFIEIYLGGFKQALEIFGDKKFSDEDMMQLVKSSFYAGLSKGQGKNQDFNIDDYVKEHLQQTEWDVEIEMICPHPMDTYRCGLKYGCDGDGCNHPEQVPYLDADGCLILKRKI